MSESMKKKALITDIDNTLYDWFDIWHSCFTAMLEKTLEISKISRDELLDDIQKVFKRHQTSEYSFVLEECKSLSELYGNSLRASLDPAIEAFRLARSKSLKLYPDVLDTLTTLKNSDIKIIAFTESLQYYTVTRLKQLKLDTLIDVLYSPLENESSLIESRSEKIQTTLITRTIPPGELKPSPQVLKLILEENNLNPCDCIYVGDSEMKDIQMANDVGVFSILASYGSSHFKSRLKDYELLRRVSHWSEEEILREKNLKETNKHATPNHTAHSFSEIINFFEIKNE